MDKLSLLGPLSDSWEKPSFNPLALLLAVTGLFLAVNGRSLAVVGRPTPEVLVISPSPEGIRIGGITLTRGGPRNRLIVAVTMASQNVHSFSLG